MIDYSTFRSIKQHRETGFSQRTTATKLGLNRKTISNYWDLSDAEFDALAPSGNKLDRYQIEIFQMHSDGLSASQICSHLKKSYDMDIHLRAMQRYLAAPRTESRPRVHSSDQFQLNTRNTGNGADLLAAIYDDSIRICFFDPQYRGVLDALSYANEGVRQTERIALQQMDADTITSFITEIHRVLKPSGYLFLWVDKFSLLNDSKDWMADTGFQIVDMITWNKGKIGMGYRTRKCSEYLLILQKAPILATATWTDHSIPDVWTEKVSTKEHPHAKPVQLQKLLILSTTQSGDVVLDPCAGSFSVLESCRLANRDFLGTDIREIKGRR